MPGETPDIKLAGLLLSGLAVMGATVTFLFHHIMKGHKRELVAKDDHAKQLISLSNEVLTVTRDVKESVNSNSRAMEANTKATDKMVDRIDTLHEDIINAMRK